MMIPGSIFLWCFCYSIISFLCNMFCRSLFVLLNLFFLPLCCLFFDLRILITPDLDSVLINSVKNIYSVKNTLFCPIKLFKFGHFLSMCLYQTGRIRGHGYEVSRLLVSKDNKGKSTMTTSNCRTSQNIDTLKTHEQKVIP
jgi:hypothetical protein